MTEQKLPTLGFIGTGTINSALVKGFCRSQAADYPIVVSPQYEKNAAELHQLFPQRVSVAASIQEVADRSDWLFVAVLPKAAEEVYTNTCFRPEHKVINLIPSCSFSDIRRWIGETRLLAHIIPLVFVADVRGPIVLYPPLPEVKELLAPIGDIVEVESRQDAALLQNITGLEASFFTLLDQVVNWGAQQGLSRDLALKYTAAFFRAMSAQAALGTPERLHELADEFTPAGLNWRGKTSLEQAGGFALWLAALEQIAQQSKL